MNLLRIIMERIMNTNKIVTISVVVIVALITIPTIYKAYQKYEDNLYDTVEKKVIESAEKCYYESICQEEKITLAFLYSHNYLDKVSNPVTKEYYNEESYVERNGNQFKFIIKE